MLNSTISSTTLLIIPFFIYLQRIYTLRSTPDSVQVGSPRPFPLPYFFSLFVLSSCVRLISSHFLLYLTIFSYQQSRVQVLQFKLQTGSCQGLKVSCIGFLLYKTTYSMYMKFQCFCQQVHRLFFVDSLVARLSRQLNFRKASHRF